MKNWITGRAKYAKEDEFGRLKNITESYLIDALSFTEAEANLLKHLEEVRGGIQVVGVNKATIQDVFIYNDHQKFFKVRMAYFLTDGHSGKEKKTYINALIEANSVQMALDRHKESFKNMLLPFEVESIALTSIVEIVHAQVTPEEAEETTKEAVPAVAETTGSND